MNSISPALPDNHPIADADGNTPLHLAVESGDLDRAIELLNNQADPDVQDNGGFTPLFSACCFNYVEMAQLLLQNNANPNIPCNLGSTPLHMAMEISKELVELLLRYGADMGVKDSDGMTQLQYAMHDESEIKELFLKYCPDINMQFGHDDTSLHQAAFKNDQKCLSYLLASRNAKMNIKDGFDNTPLQVAIEYNKSEAMYSILKYYANIDPKDCFEQLIDYYSRKVDYLSNISDEDDSSDDEAIEASVRQSLDLCKKGYDLVEKIVREKIKVEIEAEMFGVALCHNDLKTHLVKGKLNLGNLPIEILRDRITQARIEEEVRKRIPPLDPLAELYEPDNSDCADGVVSSKREHDEIVDPEVQPPPTKRARRDEAN